MGFDFSFMYLFVIFIYFYNVFLFTGNVDLVIGEDARMYLWNLFYWQNWLDSFAEGTNKHILQINITNKYISQISA